MKRLERTYNRTMTAFIKVANPIKKRIKKTECIVHKFINKEALRLLKQEGYTEEYHFFVKHLLDLNKGVKWADADLKSTNHFYHHEKGIGLYGFSNAKVECVKYYKASVFYGANSDMNKALFLLGAACHLVQDSTVPAHAMKNLKKHKPLESFIIDKVINGYKIPLKDPIITYGSPEKYVIENTKFAVKTAKSFESIRIKENRFNEIADVILLRACTTTAGLLIDFYNTLKVIESKSED
ncbi:MAG: phospholipase [Clostridium sulfidigenes]|uniref:Phospholipase C n=1 Tax=Clostridium sulfidigenes TaxID=318464 RepID=A0A927W8D0_9CLOT|nr:phospholipase [Clostridium sulfidigenes]